MQREFTYSSYINGFTVQNSNNRQQDTAAFQDSMH